MNNRNQTITPEEARKHLAWPEDKDHPKVRGGSGQARFEVQAGESHPYWNRLPDAPYEDAVMYAVARAAITTVAGMREEWGVAYRRDNENEKRITWGWDTREDAERSMKLMTRVHVYGPVHRYVTEAKGA